ncbi:MAG TPA: serine/threonine-protein kinase [Kofleriaceae bacterium]|nr:serine/threonine-protein kinase [Kofleriaceae bacterium]
MTGGDTLGSYRLASRLGTGGMGEVWLAEHVLLGRRVAIKLLRPELCERTDIVERFFDEARAAAQLADPGIVQVHDFGRHDGRAYIVMEYLDGEALSVRLARVRCLPPAVALRFAQQVALTMAVAHGRGVVHRDLKPDNLFVVADAVAVGGERVKILDFGIAKLLANVDDATRTQAGALLGTPMYMSPEQCRDAATVDHRTDIYALGAVLYHALCGRPPFAGTTSANLIAAHLAESPVAPGARVPELAPEIDALVLRCLAKSAEDRFATMTELARALGAVAGTPIDVATIAPLRRSSVNESAPVERPSAGLLTTLATGSGETRPGPSRRVSPIAIALVAVVVPVVLVLALASRREQVSSGSVAPPVPGSPPAPIIDAAPSDAPPADAAVPAKGKRKPAARVDDLYDDRGR